MKATSFPIYSLTIIGPLTFSKKHLWPSIKKNQVPASFPFKSWLQSLPGQAMLRSTSCPEKKVMPAILSNPLLHHTPVQTTGQLNKQNNSWESQVSYPMIWKTFTEPVPLLCLLYVKIAVEVTWFLPFLFEETVKALPLWVHSLSLGPELPQSFSLVHKPGSTGERRPIPLWLCLFKKPGPTQRVND